VFWYQVGNIDELRLDDQGLIDNLRIFFEGSKDLTRNYLARVDIGVRATYYTLSEV
jgi:hypothetical protein